jgi:general nucleoside transport system permease protein
MVVDLVMNLLFSTLNILPIYLIAAMGGYLSQQVGVYDISMEGNMTLGCALGMIGYFVGHSPWMGLLFGMGGGLLFGIVLALLTVRFKLDQIVVGFGLWFLGMGSASFLYKLYIPNNQSTTGFGPIAQWFGLSEVKGLGRFLELDVIFYLSIILLLVIWFIINRTKLGVIMRATGENPAVVDAAGINIFLVRTVTVLVGVSVVGAAGAYLAVDFLQGYTQGMVAGRGWIAFAIIIFARWKPSNIFWGCLLFAGINGLQVRLQVIGLRLPSDLLTALPYVFTLLVLVLIMSRRRGKSRIPSSLGQAYFRE